MTAAGTPHATSRWTPRLYRSWGITESRNISSNAQSRRESFCSKRPRCRRPEESGDLDRCKIFSRWDWFLIHCHGGWVPCSASHYMLLYRVYTNDIGQQSMVDWNSTAFIELISLHSLLYLEQISQWHSCYYAYNQPFALVVWPLWGDLAWYPSEYSM